MNAEKTELFECFRRPSKDIVHSPLYLFLFSYFKHKHNKRYCLYVYASVILLCQSAKKIISDLRKCKLNNNLQKNPAKIEPNFGSGPFSGIGSNCTKLRTGSQHYRIYRRALQNWYNFYYVKRTISQGYK